ncbi:MAG: hypothetical protein R3C09_25810 [Pirellulaceae bacterium]
MSIHCWADAIVHQHIVDKSRRLGMGQSSTNQQIESLQQQLDQLRAETNLPAAGQPVVYQQPAFPGAGRCRPFRPSSL